MTNRSPVAGTLLAAALCAGGVGATACQSADAGFAEAQDYDNLDAWREFVDRHGEDREHPKVQEGRQILADPIMEPLGDRSAPLAQRGHLAPDPLVFLGERRQGGGPIRPQGLEGAARVVRGAPRCAIPSGLGVERLAPSLVDALDATHRRSYRVNIEAGDARAYGLDLLEGTGLLGRQVVLRHGRRPAGAARPSARERTQDRPLAAGAAGEQDSVHPAADLAPGLQLVAQLRRGPLGLGRPLERVLAALASQVPGLSDLTESAPTPAASGGLGGLGGLGGGVAGLVGGLMGGGGAGGALGLVASLAQSGLGADQARGFVGMLVEFLKQKAGQAIVAKVLGGSPEIAALLK